MTLKADDVARHRKFGQGRVLMTQGQTAIVRFEHGIEQCPSQELQPVVDLTAKVSAGRMDDANRVLARLLAESIRSVNSAWGVFATSRIELLPHQLWVCRKVLERLPARWLVADDVGLGKTIEAGLVLWPLLAGGGVSRLLIICPASLCRQWEERLSRMFDIRASVYSTDHDRSAVSFWENSPLQVIASLQTLRADATPAARKRQQRLLDSPAWDMVIVDEAHHLNEDERSGPTLGARLIRALLDRRKVSSMLFFTATPHRGKERGFLSLLNLLREDLVPDVTLPVSNYLDRLPQVMIRNNKQAVTDLQGNRLFQSPEVTAVTYSYSPEEGRFYGLLSDFIASGRAYASTLESREGQAVTLVLIAMQKLAASSVAAIRRALEGRLNRLRETAGKRPARVVEEAIDDLDDAAAEQTMTMVESFQVQLVRNEIVHLEELLLAAGKIDRETKVERILEIVRRRFEGRSVLLFTEYKATQSLVMGALAEEYGAAEVTFINGDGEARNVPMLGSRRTLRLDRQQAAERFNQGKVRFLVSTEAAGEGIDLQRSCHTLIHVDLPWNPMRLHQRVGRINRYGQTKRVEVVLLRNPDTVEAQIWLALDEKIRAITQALASVMDEPEDLANLVLGTAPGAAFDALFFEANQHLGDPMWIRRQADSLGPQETIEAVKELFGSCARFDFKSHATSVPKVDLPELRPFLELMLSLERKRLMKEPDGTFSVVTPEAWRQGMELLDRYGGVTFERNTTLGAEKVLGAGHRLVARALQEAIGGSESLAVVSSSVLPAIVVLRVYDQVTTQQASVRSVVIGALFDPESGTELGWRQDWELILLLNDHLNNTTRSTNQQQQLPQELVERCLQFTEAHWLSFAGTLDIPFVVPASEPLLVIWPELSKRRSRVPLSTTYQDPAEQ